jgi:hypothetical protein
MNDDNALTRAASYKQTLNARLLVRQLNIEINQRTCGHETAIFNVMSFNDDESVLLCERQLLYHSDIDINHVLEWSNTEISCSLMFEHALLVHGSV